jgi:hypothetical protein
MRLTDAGDTLVDLDGRHITLVDVDPGSLQIEDFIF